MDFFLWALAAAVANEQAKQKFSPLMVKMRVYDVKQDAEIRARVFDYNDFELRKWYGKTVIWALMQGHAIELVLAGAE